MAILIDQDSQIILQGATGRQGRYHLPKLLDYGVRVVGGVSPGKGGQNVDDIPVYDTVAEVVTTKHVDATMIMIPPAGVLNAAVEAIDSRIPLIVIITEHVPLHDALVIRSLAEKAGLYVIGPNTVGVTSPGKCKLSVSPASIFSQGPVGVISRSGTLTHELASSLSYHDIGQSTCVCIGGDMSKTTNFIDVLKLFRDDQDTDIVVMIGEIGGAGEEIAARYIKESKYPKTVVAYIAGATAPSGKKMGHAGAIIKDDFGTADSKISHLKSAGVEVARGLDELLEFVKHRV